MNTNFKKKEIVNPVFNTAKYTLTILNNSGIKEAKKFLRALKFNKKVSMSYGLKNASTNNLILPTTIIQEARYKYINRIINSKKIKNIYDLACGFSPRGYKYSQLGYKYVGADLPATIDLLNQTIDNIIDDTCKIPFEYAKLDLTNPVSVLNEAKRFNGEICITTEGLLIYFNSSEISQFIEGVKSVLKKYGGCFVTPDFSTGEFYKVVTFALLGQKEGIKALYSTLRNLEKTSDTSINTKKLNKDSNESSNDVSKKFFESKGLNVDIVPFYEYNTHLKSLSNIDSDTAKTIKKGLHDIPAWIVTLNDDNKETQITQNSNILKKSTISLCDKQLNIILAGRIDTVSSPSLITMFHEKTRNKQYNSITVDMKNVEYISSAGLRFLIMLQESLGERPINIINASTEILNILEQWNLKGLNVFIN